MSLSAGQSLADHTVSDADLALLSKTIENLEHAPPLDVDFLWDKTARVMHAVPSRDSMPLFTGSGLKFPQLSSCLGHLEPVNPEQYHARLQQGEGQQSEVDTFKALRAAHQTVCNHQASFDKDEMVPSDLAEKPEKNQDKEPHRTCLSVTTGTHHVKSTLYRQILKHWRWSLVIATDDTFDSLRTQHKALSTFDLDVAMRGLKSLSQALHLMRCDAPPGQSMDNQDEIIGHIAKQTTAGLKAQRSSKEAREAMLPDLSTQLSLPEKGNSQLKYSFHCSDGWSTPYRLVITLHQQSCPGFIYEDDFLSPDDCVASFLPEARLPDDLLQEASLDNRRSCLAPYIDALEQIADFTEFPSWPTHQWDPRTATTIPVKDFASKHRQNVAEIAEGLATQVLPMLLEDQDKCSHLTIGAEQGERASLNAIIQHKFMLFAADCVQGYELGGRLLKSSNPTASSKFFKSAGHMKDRMERLADDVKAKALNAEKLAQISKRPALRNLSDILNRLNGPAAQSQIRSVQDVSELLRLREENSHSDWMIKSGLGTKGTEGTQEATDLYNANMAPSDISSMQTRTKKSAGKKAIKQRPQQKRKSKKVKRVFSTVYDDNAYFSGQSKETQRSLDGSKTGDRSATELSPQDNLDLPTLAPMSTPPTEMPSSMQVEIGTPTPPRRSEEAERYGSSEIEDSSKYEPSEAHHLQCIPKHNESLGHMKLQQDSANTRAQNGSQSLSGGNQKEMGSHWAESDGSQAWQSDTAQSNDQVPSAERKTATKQVKVSKWQQKKVKQRLGKLSHKPSAVMTELEAPINASTLSKYLSEISETERLIQSQAMTSWSIEDEATASKSQRGVYGEAVGFYTTDTVESLQRSRDSQGMKLPMYPPRSMGDERGFVKPRKRTVSMSELSEVRKNELDWSVLPDAFILRDDEE